MADLFAVSASGMEAQRLRMNIISSNLANVETTRTAEGGPYRRRDIVFASQDASGFGAYLRTSLDKYSTGVKIAGVVEDARPLKVSYEPNHPDADKNGFVSYPNVSAVEEMVNMLSASRSYEANVNAFKATRDMVTKAIELGQ